MWYDRVCKPILAQGLWGWLKDHKSSPIPLLKCHECWGCSQLSQVSGIVLWECSHHSDQMSPSSQVRSGRHSVRMTLIKCIKGLESSKGHTQSNGLPSPFDYDFHTKYALWSHTRARKPCFSPVIWAGNVCLTSIKHLIIKHTEGCKWGQ